MRGHAREHRDRVVRGLARLSLIGVLAVMGALFVGSAAAADGSGTPGVDVQQAEPNQVGVLDDVSPAGLMMGIVVIGGGLVVLMVGAFKPPVRERQREFADLMRE